MRKDASFNLTTPLLDLVRTQDLSGYEDEFYFEKDGWQIYRAPSHGKGITHTKNSTYPRSELRQTLADGSVKQANWLPTAGGSYVLRGWCRIDSVAKSGKLIWSQWHGESDHPPMKGNLTDGDLYAHLRRGYNSKEDKPVIYPGYKLGTPFYYIWVLKNGLLNLYIDGKRVITDYLYDLKSYARDSWYAKAGCYSQQNIKEDDVSLGEGCVAHRDTEQYWTDEEVDLSIPPLPGTVPPVVVVPPPVVVVPPAPAPRTPADIEDDVNDILCNWKDGDTDNKTAEAAIQALKVEADTFPVSAARSSVYAAVKGARAVMRATPGETDYSGMLDLADALTGKPRAIELQRITDLIDAAGIPKADKAPLYNRIKAMKL